MKFQPVETLDEGVGSDESFNQLKLWLEVWRRMKFQPDETLVGGEVWQHEAMRARMCVDAQVCHFAFARLDERVLTLPKI